MGGGLLESVVVGVDVAEDFVGVGHGGLELEGAGGGVDGGGEVAFFPLGGGEVGEGVGVVGVEGEGALVGVDCFVGLVGFGESDAEVVVVGGDVRVGAEGGLDE